MQKPDKLRPGERLFALLLLAFAGFAFSQAYSISGLKGLTTGGVMPMLASAVMLVSGVFILVETFRRAPTEDAGLIRLVAYLTPLRVVLFAVLVAGYALLIPAFGFLAASAAFLFVGIWGLWRKGPLWALVIAALSTGAIYVLFRIVFQVVLPMGSLWR